MTTTLLTPLPPLAAAAVPAPAPAGPPPALACGVELRALRSGVRDLASALTAIAFDAPCCPERQREIAGFAGRTLHGVRGSADRVDDAALHAAAVAAEDALPLFASDVTAGAPALARALAALADLLDERAAAGGGHEHGSPASLLVCERRFRKSGGSARFTVPWFLDACSPAERVALVLAAPRRVRMALRFGEDRYLRALAAVRGTAE